MTGRARALDLVPGLRELAQVQCNVVRREQLRALGVEARHVRHQVDAQRWTTYGGSVVVLSTGELTPLQRRAVAVAHAGPSAALAGLTALGVLGLRGWDREEVHVVVPQGRAPAAMRGVVVHYTRRLAEHDLHPGIWPACTSALRSTVDAVTWEGSSRTAAALVLAVVQQRLARPADLLTALDRPGPSPHRQLLRSVLADAKAGADALSELDVAAIVRQVGLPEPRRQVTILTPDGPRRVDLAVDLPDGRILVIEIDGVHHYDARVREDDAVKDAALLAAGYVVLRIPVTLLRRRPGTVLAQLRAIVDACRARPA